MHKGTQIKIARITMGLSQQQLADRIHKTRSLVSSIEQTGQVNIHTLEKIGEVLNMDIEALKFTLSDNSSAVYGKKTPKAEQLELEVTFLKKELQTLQELVDTQRDVIAMLKEKISKKG
jgi:transcriptional regulator with XRE-family HTH domain